MNYNGLTRGLYELNSFKAFMKIKKLWFSGTSEFVEQTLWCRHGNKTFSTLHPRTVTIIVKDFSN